MEAEHSSNRLDSLRRRLSSLNMGVDTPTWRDRLPSLYGGQDVPAQTLRKRLSNRSAGERFSPDLPTGPSRSNLGDRLQSSTLGSRLCCSSLRGYLTRPELGEHLTRPELGEYLDQPELGEHLTRPELGEHLTRPELGEHLTRPKFGEHLTRPSVEQRLGSASIERPSLPDTEAMILEREGIDLETHESPTTAPEYFVGVIPESHDTVLEQLEESAFGLSRVTYPKILDDDEFDIRVEAASVWVYRSWSLSHFQLHVPLFEIPGEEGVHVFFHHEYNWLRHPSTHKEGEYLNPVWGREQVLELFDEAGLTIQTSDNCADPNEFAATYWQAAESREVQA
jgi:hypothetical protein